MGPAMRRGFVHVLAWSLATGAAVTLSWWGVHTVMAGTAYDPPRALPVTAADGSGRESDPLASSTKRPTPTRAPTAQGPSPNPAATAPKTPFRPAPSRSATPNPGPSPATSGRVRSYATDGGRAVFDLGPASATLVSATPRAGWSMQVWKTEKWIRVEYAAGADRVSVFCTWHDGPPRVEIGTY
jgi:hypothetical protein